MSKFKTLAMDRCSQRRNAVKILYNPSYMKFLKKILIFIPVFVIVLIRFHSVHQKQSIIVIIIFSEHTKLIPKLCKCIILVLRLIWHGKL